ncbi:hypothetical protein C7C46_01930 [Streptomyces tateyamensis]|uniref:Uncharacterized protein n=1 Tax=Streptomyces tateyamensis TaxID=565073 RepID=A0A2V4NN62_9ACTN|nr:hypothetical protein [Streptomyces tateyamensis]PYC88051.1 hypothetical protein C7C46_01930 [Streptomyces tateyamensis]
MFSTAQWPVVWVGVLLIFASIGLVLNLRMRRSSRSDHTRRRTYLEWLPGLVGLLAVVGEPPRILGASRGVLTVTDNIGRVIIVGILVLLLYGGIVLIRRVLRAVSRLRRTPPAS